MHQPTNSALNFATLRLFHAVFSHPMAASSHHFLKLTLHHHMQHVLDRLADGRRMVRDIAVESLGALWYATYLNAVHGSVSPSVVTPVRSSSGMGAALSRTSSGITATLSVI